jgi:hypothetical protein
MARSPKRSPKTAFPLPQLLATGDVSDLNAPFSWTCTTLADGHTLPILTIHRPGNGQFNFTFNPAAFAGGGRPRLFVSSDGLSGQGINNADAYVRYQDAMHCSVFTTVNASVPTNSSFSFLIIEYFGAPLTPIQGGDHKE